MARKIEWTDAARADVRRVDREIAMRILEGLARFLLTEEGDVKLLKDSDPKEYRLRVGDYRIRFHDLGDTGLPTVPLLRVARFSARCVRLPLLNPWRLIAGD